MLCQLVSEPVVVRLASLRGLLAQDRYDTSQAYALLLSSEQRGKKFGGLLSAVSESASRLALEFGGCFGASPVASAVVLFSARFSAKLVQLSGVAPLLCSVPGSAVQGGLL